jgi:RNA polymerase sigma factor for flagellar operon FliA
VEARVDTGIVLRRLEGFFASLPERERMVIDAYLGVGLTPVEVAETLQVSPSRVSQIYHAVVKRVVARFGPGSQHDPAHQRATDRHPDARAEALAELVRQREAALAATERANWGALVEQVLTRKPGDETPPPSSPPDEPFLVVTPETRWG